MTAERPAPPAHTSIFMIMNGAHVAGAVSCLALLGIPDLIDAASKSAEELATRDRCRPTSALPSHARHRLRWSAIGRPRRKIFANANVRNSAQRRHSQSASLCHHDRQRVARTRLVPPGLLCPHRQTNAGTNLRRSHFRISKAKSGRRTNFQRRHDPDIHDR